MKRVLVAAATLSLALGAGGAWADDDPTKGRAERYDADNTGRNVRDRDGGTLTSGDQGGSDRDRELTAAVRRTIVADDSLSMNAHNVKIVTVDGVVTLRGPVQTESERTAVAAKAQQVAGVKRVDNQLEIARD
jgi:osmotically-inducible protein OsmY